ncbi:PKD domain-containing protein [Halosimplex pelagicum]|uniref:PKD domain-containing protein n=1 Tax=Halosimplex pelagicum TaxID=869886 RepID=A0A7D5T6R2_9EURY|nr:PKD domain-containing protein [Halosimplex pelagicum]QLH84351.1 PKD domain-containing protein [Halosimplex pelagicum]
MIRWGQGITTAVVSAVVVSAVFAGVTVAGATVAAGASGPDDGGNESPLAEAGLDQTVSANTTVYLDATGSRDPDGEIGQYRWRLELPDGSYTTPSCETCGRTKFVPRETGTYNATVTVTDEDGATSADTLRVHVEPSSGPSVTLSGPDSVVAGSIGEYSASVSAGANDLAGVVWRADGRRLNRTTLTGESASVDHLHAFRSGGTVTLSATAVDRLGRERTATKNVTVTDPSLSDDSGSGSGYSTGGSDDDRNRCSRYGADDTYCNNDRMTLDSNGIVISDADNDGSARWAGVTIDEEFAQNHEGVSYDSTDGVVEFDGQEAYKEALEVDSVNVNPDARVNSNQEKDDQEDRSDGNEFGYGDSSSGDDTGSSNEDESTKDKTDNSNSNTGSGNSGQIPERVMDIIQNERGGSSSANQNETNTGDTNTRTGRVPPGRNNGGF